MQSRPQQDTSIGPPLSHMEPTWPPAHSQAVLCPEQSCARARPWLNHNCNLRHFAVASGEVPEAPTAAAHASQMQDIDITSPGTPNATRIGIDNVAAELSQRFAAAAATTSETAKATVAHASTAQHVEVSALNPHAMHAELCCRLH